ncbi:MAG TPA: hypothetical protein VNE18_01825 [Rhodanobacter sp.]|nr:hypothetical protein [Rhodanobacter sp.]
MDDQMAIFDFTAARHPAAHGGEADHRQLAQSAGRLDPVETLLDAFADRMINRHALIDRGIREHARALHFTVESDGSI